LSFRRKLLAIFALTVIITVASVAFVVSDITRRAFEQSEIDRTNALVAQFNREFNRRGEDLLRRVEAIVASETVGRMSLNLSRPSPESGPYVNEAAATAKAQGLEFLEFVDGNGTIVSSAQWPAKFGYKEPLLAEGVAQLPSKAFLKREETSSGATLGLFVVRVIRVGEKPLFVVGGRRLDREFLSTLEFPAGMRVMLYSNLQPDYSPQWLVDNSGALPQAERLEPLIHNVQATGSEQNEIVKWSSDSRDSESIHTIPLKGQQGDLLGILLVGNSRRGLVELEKRIRAAALLGGSLGILLAIAVSSWASARVTRPVVQLADAAREVAAGNWNVQVETTARDELGDLAQAFNRMTRELLDQRERLVQAERVAAWRELARRLAHELKNPLFPLQITVENLLKARDQNSDQFEEIFHECASTLLEEISHLKTIIGRFSDFSKMPKPQLQSVNPNELVRGVLRLHQRQLDAKGRPAIKTDLQFDKNIGALLADPDLLHRALSNLMLNAIDAMPTGGTLTLRTRKKDARIVLEISDTGAGLNKEECDRLFTPYYTTKQHGTGLGLAIVQSVVSDHQGRIRVISTPGRGTTFVIELPAQEQAAAQAG